MLTPWANCTAREPPIYGLNPQDHVQVCAPGSSSRRDCNNPHTGKKDFGLGVQTGSAAPEFALRRASDPSSTVSLSELLKEKAVLVQFGAYT